MLFWKPKAITSCCCKYWVSILILLDVILEVSNFFNLNVKDFCFNPYFVGCYSGSATNAPAHTWGFMFQSLFCWMLFWKINLIQNEITQLTVSILILLDVILEVYGQAYYEKVEACFNPYFVGCYSGSGIARNIQVPISLFQSLFCWMLFWKPITAKFIINSA